MNFELLTTFGWAEVPIALFAVLLGVVFFLVIRQNAKDYLDLVAGLESEARDSPP